jgi:hypothetical protein
MSTTHHGATKLLLIDQGLVSIPPSLAAEAGTTTLVLDLSFNRIAYGLQRSPISACCTNSLGGRLLLLAM